MNAITTPSVFNFTSSAAVRVVKINEAPWFVASDVCAALDIANTTQALTRLDDDEQALYSNEGIHRGDDQVNVINESGLYSLILGSRKPEAKKFKKWVTSEVLPAIRKTGGYVADKTDTIRHTPAAKKGAPSPLLLKGESTLDLYFAALQLYAGNYTNKAALWLGLSEVVFAKLGIKCLDGITDANLDAAIHIIADDMAVQQMGKQCGCHYLRPESVVE